MTDEAKRDCWLFHRWTKWEQYAWRGINYGSRLMPNAKPHEISERRQKRHCLDCGKEQDELVRNG